MNLKNVVYPVTIFFVAIVAGYVALTVTGHSTTEFVKVFLAPLLSLASTVVAGVAVYHTTQSKKSIINDILPLLQDVNVKVNGNLAKLIEKVAPVVADVAAAEQGVPDVRPSGRQNIP